MNALRETLTRWKTMLAGLPIGRRLALTAVPLVAVVALAVTFGLGGGSNTTLLDDGRSFTSDELRQMPAAFRSAKLTGFRVEGQRVRVPTRDAYRFEQVVASIRSAGDGHGDEFTKAREQTNIFTNSRERSELQDQARAKELAKIIRGIPGIEDASVLWDRSRHTSLRGNGKLTATISVRPKSGFELTRVVADSLRQTVAGAIADLRTENVTVLNLATGQVIPVGDDSTPLSPFARELGGEGLSAHHSTRPTIPDERRATTPHPTPHPSPLPSPLPKGERELRLLAERDGDVTATTNESATFGLTPAGGSALLVASGLLALGIIARAWRNALVTRRHDQPTAATPAVTDHASEPPGRPTELADDAVARFDMAPRTQHSALSTQHSVPSTEYSVLCTQYPVLRTQKSTLNLDTPERAADPSSLDLAIDGEPHAAPANSFGFLDGVELPRLALTLRDEHPQTVALVLAHVPPEAAEVLLDSLPNGSRWQVERRMANVQPASPEIVREVARAVERRLSADSRLTPSDGGEGTGHGASAAVAAHPLGFPDLARLGRDQLQTLVARLPRSQWVLALKAASPEVKARVLECFSSRQANLLWEEINQLGPLRVRDLDAAQHAIATEAHRLFGLSECDNTVPAGDPAADAVRDRVLNLRLDVTPSDRPNEETPRPKLN
jgi:flagellar motor switch protein FliG